MQCVAVGALPRELMALKRTYDLDQFYAMAGQLDLYGGAHAFTFHVGEDRVGCCLMYRDALRRQVMVDSLIVEEAYRRPPLPAWCMRATVDLAELVAREYGLLRVVASFPIALEDRFVKYLDDMRLQPSERLFVIELEG